MPGRWYTDDGVYVETGAVIRFEITVALSTSVPPGYGAMPIEMLEAVGEASPAAMGEIVRRVEASVPDGYRLKVSESYASPRSGVGSTYEWKLYKRDDESENLKRLMDRED